ncbi:MAG TPA: hypothetical protein VGM06_16670 [Polyangiaceae bacterium]
MRIEAILSHHDIEELLGQFIPLEIDLDEGKGARVLSVDELTDVTVVRGEGVRIGCKAHIHWPVLGIPLPVAIKSLHILVSFRVALRESRESLVIGLKIEDADIAWVPSIVDQGLKDLVNRELVEKHIELVWGFGKTLSTQFKMPKALRSAEALVLDVSEGRVAVSAEAVGMAVAYAAKVLARPKA